LPLELDISHFILQATPCYWSSYKTFGIVLCCEEEIKRLSPVKSCKTTIFNTKTCQVFFVILDRFFQKILFPL